MDPTLDIIKEQVIDFKQYKWLVSSCLQKSLRRGRYDLAESYVRFLWEHDRNYITYRFGTILAEDVGIANLPLVKEYLDTKLGKKAIDEKGGLDFILKITKDACESVKDRSSCDSAYLCSYYNLHNPENKTYEDLFADPKEHYIDRINAGWAILGGNKFNNPQLDYLPKMPSSLEDSTKEIIVDNHDTSNIVVDKDKDNVKPYLELVNKLTSSELANIVENAYRTQIENISLGMPIIYDRLQHESQNSKESKIQVGDVIEHNYVKEEAYFHKPTGLHFISAGIDGHTREGKSVYYQFLKSKNSFVDYLKSKNVPDEQYMLIFSHCMFRVEGHEVNKRLYFPTAVEVMRDCESVVLNLKANRDDLDFSILKKAILEAIPTLNKMREQQLVKSPVPMMDKPEPKTPKKSKKNIV